MKTIITHFNVSKLSLLIILPVLLIACDRILTESPDTFLSEETVFATEEGAEAATFGVYHQLRDSWYYGRWFSGFLNMHADYGLGRGSQAPVGRYELDSQNINRMGTMWTQIYEKINRANIVIQQLSESGGISSDLNNQLTAEARFLRALGYYNLVRLWGDVPLRLEPETNVDNLGIPRSPTEEVYKKIIEDLEYGENNLPDSYSTDNIGRATSWAAKTLLADVFLTLERWDESATKAKEVIDSEQFILVRINSLEDWHTKLFGPNVTTYPEEILSIKYADDQENAHLPYFHRGVLGYTSGSTHAWLGNLDSFIGKGNWANEDSPDLRRNNTLYHGEETIALDDNIQMLFSKFKGTTTNESNDFPLLRYAEALLIFAEAESQALGAPSPEAYEAVNKVRRRAYGKDPETPDIEADLPAGLSAEAFQDSVVMERAKEFVVEGKRWFDLLRTNTALEVIQGMGQSITEKNLKWSIPQEEIDNNDALTQEDQNPGW